MGSKAVKNLLFFLIILSFSFAIAGQFYPIVSFSSDDLFDDANFAVEDRTWDWDHSYYFICSRTIVTGYILCSIGEQPTYRNTIYLLHIIPIKTYESGYMVKDPTGYELQYSNSEVIEHLFIPIFVLASLMMALFYLIFSIKSIVNVNRKKTKDSLYAGVLCFICLSTLVFSFYYYYATAPPLVGIERENYITIGLGFYYFLISGILFIVFYFLQKKFYITDEENNVVGFKKEVKMLN